MAVRFTAKQYEALIKGKAAPQEKERQVIAGGYAAHWRGWAEVGGNEYHFRSLSEYNYACYLEWLRTRGEVYKWLYEPKRFYFKEFYSRGPYDYLPDFKVYTSKTTYSWHEVKGYMNSKSRSKIKRFEKHYPKEGQVVVIGPDWFKSMGNASILVPGWKTLEQMR